jgi:hypothetical protein
MTRLYRGAPVEFFRPIVHAQDSQATTKPIGPYAALEYDPENVPVFGG